MTSHTLLFRVAVVIIIVLVGYISIPSLLNREHNDTSSDAVMEPVPLEDATTSLETAPLIPDDSSSESPSDDLSDEEDNDVESDSSEGGSGATVTAPAPPKEAVPPVVTDTEETVVPSTPRYTKETVATHNDATSCWSIIDGNVYDLTSFVDDHPGGERNILKICGKDGTDAFMGQHGGESKPEKTLAGFLLGPLTQ